MNRTFATRRVWKSGKGRTGTLAELSDLLQRRGYVYQYQPRVDPSGKFVHNVANDLGRAIFKNSQGNMVALKRIARGAPAMFTGATVGLVRTAAQPDVWQMFKRQRR